MGHCLFLRHLLVAHLSHDSLRAHLSLAGLSAPGIASRPGSNFSRLFQCRADSIDHAVWVCRSLYRAAYVGVSGVDALHGNGPSLERARLFPSIPSRIDSVCPLGWCLCGEFSNCLDERRACVRVNSSRLTGYRCIVWHSNSHSGNHRRGLQGSPRRVSRLFNRIRSGSSTERANGRR